MDSIEGEIDSRHEPGEETSNMNEDSFSFVIYMLHACADRWHTTPAKVYQAVKDSGCIDQYLIPYYDILHTQSTDYVVHDIDEYLKNRGMSV